MADLPINTLLYGSQVRPAVGPAVQPNYAPVPMPDPRRHAPSFVSPSNAVATATDTGGGGGFFDKLTAGFSDPLTLMGMQMIGNGGMSIGTTRPMFQGVPQVLEAAQGMQLREEQSQQKRAEQEAEAERRRILADTIIPQLPANLHALAQVDPEGALAIHKQMQPKTPDSTANQNDYLFALQNGYQGTFEDWVRGGGGSSNQPASVQEYEFARGQGYDGSFTDFQRDKRPAPAMNATVMKEIFEADEAVQAGGSVVNALELALDLNKTAYDGPMAEQRAYAGAMFGDEGGKNTLLLKNEITAQALDQLKAIFGGMPTEGERKILLEIQGSADQPRAVREAIYNRAIEAAKRRIEFNRQNAESLRSGTYFDPGHAAPQPDSSVTGAGIDDLLTKYGE
jgi:hypothetical protein